MELKCSYCTETTKCECPEENNKYQDAKFVCPICVELLELGVKEDELATTSKREEVKSQIEISNISSDLAEGYMEEFFEKGWQQTKDQLKLLPKEELAEEMFYQGMRSGIISMITLQKTGTLEDVIKEFQKK